ncbi:MAG: hypothetical protein ACE5G8_07330 [Anaerolineae bacterium]
MMEKMIDTMMKRYQMFAWLGLIIVLIAFWLALTAGAGSNATFFAADKATREAAGAGSVLAVANATRHSIATWVPAFKFLGLGIMLGAITMALGSIVKTLRDLGTDVMDLWPADLNPGLPEKPRSAKMFPMIMMMGWILLIVGLVWALSLSGVATSYWNHSVAADLNPAQPGSALLAQLAIISGTLPWLSLLRFLGMSFLFTGITVALTVIIRTLQFQEKALQNFVTARSGSAR